MINSYSKILIVIIFLSLNYNNYSQESSGEKLARRVIEAIQKQNTEGLKSVQATADIYRKIAPTQMKDKSDLEVMAIVDFSGFSLFDKVKMIYESLVEAGLQTEKVKFASTKIEKFEYINSDFRVVTTYCSYEGESDTLVLEGYLKGGKWYLVDLANDDKELNNIIDKKGTVTYEQIYAKGLEAMKNDIWGDAVKIFERVIRLKPDFREAYYKCGYSYIEIGNFFKAEEILKQGNKLFPDYKDIYIELGYVYNKNGKTEEALTVFNKAITLDSGSYWAYFYCGTMLYDNERYNEAANYFDGAVKYNPSDYYNPFHSRARNSFRLKNYVAAKEDYMKLMQMKPDISDSYYFLGWIANEESDFQTAVSKLNKYLELEPDNTDAIYERGFSYKGLQQWEEAIRDFTIAREVVEKYEYKGISKSKVYKHLADCYYSSGQYQKACELYKMTVDAGDKSAEGLMKSRCK